VERLAGFMLSLFGQPIVINILPEGSVLFEIYYNPGFLPLGIDNKLDAIHIHDLAPSIDHPVYFRLCSPKGSTLSSRG